MKLRIRGNSVRLRLTRGEVDQLIRTGTVRESAEFDTASPGFSYQVTTSADGSRTRATFENNCLTVSIPADNAENWIQSKQIGIEELQPIDNHKFLRILVEKDFQCRTDRAGEDDIDAFPNPFAEEQC